MKFRAMLNYTLLEAIRRGTLIFYFIAGTLIILAFAIWLRIAPETPGSIVLFGNRIPESINGMSSTEFFLSLLFKQSTFWIIVLGTFGVAGLMTSFLEKGTIELYLSKPLDRWELFLSRALGACAGVAANLLYCIVGIWLVFGFKIGVWHTGFLLAGMLVAYAFVCYFSVVAFIAVWTRSAILSIVFGLFFSFSSIGLENRAHSIYKLWDNVVFHRIIDALYYLTPQLDGMLSNAGRLIGQTPFSPEPASFSPSAFLCSLGSAALFYFLSVFY
ncbi:MAG TPA: hypothetical protein VI758_11435, partial [Bacteroidota bacterium]